MSNYNNERNDLSELAFLYCKDIKGIKRNILNSMCIEARCTILNRFLRLTCNKQYSSRNLEKLAIAIYDKNNGQLLLKESLKIIWNKNYIDIQEI